MRLTDTENKLPMVTSEKREGTYRDGGVGGTVLGCNRGYKDAFYNTGNIVYIF